jgi:hypothetical protein
LAVDESAVEIISGNIQTRKNIPSLFFRSDEIVFQAKMMFDPSKSSAVYRGISARSFRLPASSDRAIVHQC